MTTPGGIPASWHSWPMSVADIGRLLGRLEHHGVAAGEGGDDEVDDERRAVPRHDDADDAERLAVTYTATSGDTAGIVPLIFDGQPA